MTDLAIPDMSEDEARDLTNRIRQSVSVAWAQIAKAYQGRAWLALGYDSWDDYTDAEFDGARLRLPREERTMVVASLRDAGLSTRAIAAATGVSRPTIQKDLTEQVVNSLPPADPDDEIVDAEVISEPPAPQTVTGVDGKSYTLKPKPEPPAPRRPPLTDTADNAAWKVRKSIESIERVFEDDRFPSQREQVAAKCRGHLIFAAEVCQDLLGRLDTNQTGED